MGNCKKDFYDTFCIPKNLLSNILGYLAMIILAVLIGAKQVYDDAVCGSMYSNDYNLCFSDGAGTG